MRFFNIADDIIKTKFVNIDFSYLKNINVFYQEKYLRSFLITVVILIEKPGIFS